LDYSLKILDKILQALLLGAASIIANFVFLPLLQKSITTKRIVQLSLVIMTISYFYLTKVTQFDEIIVGMPFQVSKEIKNFNFKILRLSVFASLWDPFQHKYFPFISF